MSANIFDIIEQKRIVIKFERAINDLRKGVPIIFNNEALVFATESLEKPILDSLHQYKKTLLISKNRANTIGIKSSSAIGIDFDIVSLEYINQITCDHLYILESKNYSKDSEYDKILEIIKLSKLIPSALVIKNSQSNNELIKINYEEVEQYKILKDDELQEIFVAPLNLEDSKNIKIVTFRPKIGGEDHYAIVVGDLSSAEVPYVRIHSSCYTGDLLGSLDCDCGDQLRESLKLIAHSKEKTGVIIYLMQEGRGIGLTNKLRTYVLQNKGLDTVSANLALGFEDDERSFNLASKILKLLDTKKIKLITNNPKKIDEIQKYGIQVLETVPMVTKNATNSKYFKTKIEKLGHIKN